MDSQSFNAELIKYLIDEKKFSITKNHSFSLIQNLEFVAPKGTSTEVACSHFEDFLKRHDDLTFVIKNNNYKVSIKGHVGIKLIIIIAYPIELMDYCCFVTIADKPEAN